MTATMARRFSIICLLSILFAFGLLQVVQNHSRTPQVGNSGLGAPCPQPSNLQCLSHI